MRLHSARQAWAPVVGFEDTHMVSDFGEVMTLDRKLTNCLGVVRNWPSAMLKPTRKSNGYIHITLCGSDSKSKTVHVHRMVLEAFVGPCPEGYEALHNDGDKQNNLLSNLRWGTHLENCIDRSRHGGTGSVLSYEKATRIRAMKGRATQKEIASRFGVDQSTISAIHRGKMWAVPLEKEVTV